MKNDFLIVLFFIAQLVFQSSGYPYLMPFILNIGVIYFIIRLLLNKGIKNA